MDTMSCHPQSMPRAKAAALNALEIDPTFAEANAALGYVKLAYDRDLVGATRELERALALKPTTRLPTNGWASC